MSQPDRDGVRRALDRERSAPSAPTWTLGAGEPQPTPASAPAPVYTVGELRALLAGLPDSAPLAHADVDGRAEPLIIGRSDADGLTVLTVNPGLWTGPGGEWPLMRTPAGEHVACTWDPDEAWRRFGRPGVQ